MPFPAPGGRPDPGIEPTPPALQAQFLPLSHLENPPSLYNFVKCSLCRTSHLTKVIDQGGTTKNGITPKESVNDLVIEEYNLLARVSLQ